MLFSPIVPVTFLVDLTCFLKPPQRAFSESTNAGLYSKVRFVTDVETSRGLNMDPWSDILKKKIDERGPSLDPEACFALRWLFVKSHPKRPKGGISLTLDTC